MSSLLDQLFSSLTSETGNIVFHILLVSSIAFSLQAAFNHWRSSDFPQARRTMIGLGVLFVAQIGLFVIAGLGWQEVLNLEVLLPPLDRAFTLLTLVWVTWLWAFPEPSRSADSAAGLMSLLISAALFLSVASMLGAQSSVGGSFNTSLQELIWQFISIAFALVGALILLVRRPSGWGNGVAFLSLAFLGHLGYLLTGSASGDYPGAVRLAYLAAYPILLTLPQRFPIAREQSPINTIKEDASALESRRYSTDPKTFHALLDLAAETTQGKVSKAITRSIAQTMLADLCFLIYLTDNSNQLVIAAGYDLIREEVLEGGSLNKTAIPMLSSAIQRGRPLRLPASATSADIKGLGDVLGIGNPGNLLCVPMLTKDKESIGGILLLSPYSNRNWSAEDQAFLANIATSMVSIAQRSQQMTALQEKEQAARESLEQARAQAVEVDRKNNELQRQLEVAIAEPSEEIRARLESLEAENESMRQRAGRALTNEVEQLEKELRITLEDASRLQNQVARANAKVLELEQAQKSPRSREQAEVVTSISQELRQPMSSIIGYTDLLLGESVGILGALQRKFVERVKASTERIGNLIDDLIQVTAIETGLADLKPESVDLNLIIDNAMSYTSSQIREKNITLHLDLPRQMEPILADRESLQQILIHLLQNAGAASPMEGRITVKVQTRRETGQDYVQIQVTDNGGGIPAAELPRVFTRLYRADNVLIQGVGDTGVGLSIAKTLTEAQHGRIWVESENGVGSTFSVLLPIAREDMAVKAGESE